MTNNVMRFNKHAEKMQENNIKTGKDLSERTLNNNLMTVCQGQKEYFHFFMLDTPGPFCIRCFYTTNLLNCCKIAGLHLFSPKCTTSAVHIRICLFTVKILFMHQHHRPVKSVNSIKTKLVLFWVFFFNICPVFHCQSDRR